MSQFCDVSDDVSARSCSPVLALVVASRDMRLMVDQHGFVVVASRSVNLGVPLLSVPPLAQLLR